MSNSSPVNCCRFPGRLDSLRFYIHKAKKSRRPNKTRMPKMRWKAKIRKNKAKTARRTRIRRIRTRKGPKAKKKEKTAKRVREKEVNYHRVLRGASVRLSHAIRPCMHKRSP